MNPQDSGVYRPSDLVLLRGAIREISQASGVGILFAGLVEGRDLTITEFFGTRTASLKGLFVRPGEGVGGSALAQARPVAVTDYLDSGHITHQHDEAVRPEGLRMMVALPVLVDGTVRGVIYAANRETAASGDRLTAELVTGTQRIARELEIRDEVDRRVALLRLNAAQPTAFEDYDLVETVRIAHAELLAVSRTAHDPALVVRIEHVMAQLDGSATQRGQAGRAAALPHGGLQSAASPQLTRRELEVLAQVGLGCSYAETGRRLMLQPVTVKGYMKSINAKLGVHGRTEAVAAARRHRILP
jgi:DNA-binding CsgD family transcriptional regulator